MNLQSLKSRAKVLQTKLGILISAFGDERTPWYAKLVIALVVVYALSPIDLIPDFIPILGYVDDLILLPLGIWLVLRLIPADLIAEQRLLASQLVQRPSSKLAAGMVVGIWLLVGALMMAWIFQYRR